jgi:beta-glucosidase
MSDWGATHSTSIKQGLDQEMPGGVYMGIGLSVAVAKGTVTVAEIDDSVTRILVPMFKFGIFANAAQWNASNHKVDVTSAEHSAIARQISAASSVLLKNDGNILPLKLGTKLAVINVEAAKPTVHGGGSGSVSPTYTIAPLDAITRRNAQVPPPPGPQPPPNCTFQQDTDYYHIGDPEGHATTPTECCVQCSALGSCVAFTFKPPSTCYYHSVAGIVRHAPGLTSGHSGKHVPPGGSNVTYDDGSNVASAASVAAAADVAIVFVATSSSEGSDRPDLDLDKGQGDLITAIAKAQPNTIVVAVTPGAILMPWSPLVKGIFVVGMPGLE